MDKDTVTYHDTHITLPYVWRQARLEVLRLTCNYLHLHLSVKSDT